MTAPDRSSPWEPAGLELVATAANLIGRDRTGAELLTRAHNELAERGDAVRAAHCAFWLVAPPAGAVATTCHGRFTKVPPAEGMRVPTSAVRGRGAAVAAGHPARLNLGGVPGGHGHGWTGRWRVPELCTVPYHEGFFVTDTSAFLARLRAWEQLTRTVRQPPAGTRHTELPHETVS